MENLSTFACSHRGCSCTTVNLFKIIPLCKPKATRAGSWYSLEPPQVFRVCSEAVSVHEVVLWCSHLSLVATFSLGSSSCRHSVPSWKLLTFKGEKETLECVKKSMRLLWVWDCAPWFSWASFLICGCLLRWRTWRLWIWKLLCKNNNNEAGTGPFAVRLGSF